MKVLVSFGVIGATVLLFMPRGEAAPDTPAPWHHPLYMAKHGYWPLRLPVTMTAAGTNVVMGSPVACPAGDLAGQSIESLRVCRTDGRELLFNVLDRAGAAKHAGKLLAEDRLVLPTECKLDVPFTAYVYAGNDEAGAVPDFLMAGLKGGGSEAGSVRVSAGPVEELELTRLPARSAPQFSADWPVRAVVRVFNFQPQARDGVLVLADLRPTLGRWLKIPADAAVRMVDAETGRDIAAQVRLENSLLFSATLPPRSLREFHAYLDPKRRQRPEATLAAYETLLRSPSNQAPNPSLEETGEPVPGWSFSDGAGRKTFAAGLVNEGRFGLKAASFTVPTNVPANWVGWRSSEIPARPGARYFLSGYLASKQLDGVATLHGHWHTKDGKLTPTSAFVSTHPTVGPDAPWTRSSAFLEAPPEVASIQLHLTMNAHGTLRHDGILFCEVTHGEVTRLETAETDTSSQAARAETTPAVLRVSEVNPLIKVFPDDPPAPATTGVTIECARNEYEPFQLVVRPSGAVQALQVAVAPFRNREGQTLPTVKAERVGFVPVDHPSGYFTTSVEEWQRKLPHGPGATDGWAGFWPDPLMPATPMAVAAGRNQPFWFTVRTTSATVPGEYRGAVSFSAEGCAPVTVPIVVNVLPFALPDRTQLKAIFDLRFGPGGPYGTGAGDEEARRRWLRFLAEHRLGIDAVQPTPSFTFTNGKVNMDTTAFDATARFCFDEMGMNVSYTPWFFYLFGWAYPPKKLFGFDPFTPEWTRCFTEAYRQFSDHLERRGWRDRFVYYISDEPHFHHASIVEQMKKLCALVHSVDSRIPIYSSTWRHCPEWDQSLDIWGVGQHGSCPVATLERLRQAGKQFWFTCDGQMATDTPYLATERLLPYYCQKYGASGFEFWGMAWWTYDPWQVGWHTFIRQSDDGKTHYWIRYPNGDGYLAYPGRAAGVEGPLSTIRLEQVREGLEDHEALRLLEAAVANARRAGRSTVTGERALALVNDLITIPNAGGLRSSEILPDPERVPSLRRAVNAALVELSH